MLDHVTVLIGIAHKNRPVGGVIHQPYYNYKNDKAGLGRTMWGIPGIGVGGFKPIPPPEGKRLVVTTRSHMTPVVQQALEALKPDEILRVGGAGYKVMLILIRSKKKNT
jgi:3'(2'), 5'-bisphosphate nucleotidase